MNWASREKLPVLFTVQNNDYAISVPQTSQTGSQVHRIAQGFGMPTLRLDGTWFEHLYEALPPVIEAMRHGAGPALVEAMVVRLDPHSSSDDHRNYRGETELQTITSRDPILQTERYLLRNAVVTDEEVASLRAELKAEVDRAADEADRYPQPDESTVMAHIYCNDPALLGEPQPPCYLSGQEVTMIDAINHGLREEMERNPALRDTERSVIALDPSYIPGQILSDCEGTGTERHPP